MALHHYVCKHKEVIPATRLSHVRIFLTAARIIKCIILMADCNLERIMCL